MKRIVWWRIGLALAGVTSGCTGGTSPAIRPTMKSTPRTPLASDPVLSKALHSADRIDFLGIFGVANSQMYWTVGSDRSSKVKQAIQQFHSQAKARDSDYETERGEWVNFEIYAEDQMVLVGTFRIQGDDVEPGAYYFWLKGVIEPEPDFPTWVALDATTARSLRQLFWSHPQNIKNLRNCPYI
jgi:hypothetical protein